MDLNQRIRIGSDLLRNLHSLLPIPINLIPRLLFSERKATLSVSPNSLLPLQILQRDSATNG